MHTRENGREKERETERDRERERESFMVLHIFKMQYIPPPSARACVSVTVFGAAVVFVRLAVW